MLKNYKEKLLALLAPVKPAPNLDFGCHNVVVNGKNFLMCRAIVPDICEMLTVESSVYVGEIPLDYAKLEKQVQDKQNNLYVVIRYDDRMIAFAGCDFATEPARAVITSIAVLPEYQHQGIGLVLLETLQSEAKKYGCKKISLVIRRQNTDAKALFLHAGFKEVTVRNADPTQETDVELSYNLVNRNLKKRVEKRWKKNGN